MNKIFRAINLHSSNVNDNFQLLHKKLVTSCSNSFFKIPSLYYKKDGRGVCDSKNSNMMQNRSNLDSIPLPASPVGVNSPKGHVRAINDIEFIPLQTEKEKGEFHIAISRPKEDKSDDNFFVFDISSTPSKIDLSYLSSVSREVSSKSELKSSKRPHSIEIIEPKVAPVPIINLENDDDDDVIFEGSKSADFISLQTCHQPVNNINFVQKRLSHSDCNKCPRHNCKKIKKLKASKINDSDISLLDSTSISISQSDIKDEKSQELINIEDEETEVDKDEIVKLSDEHIAPTISNLVDRPLLISTNDGNDLNNNSDSEEGEIAEDKLKLFEMESKDTTSCSRPIDANGALKIDDKDFVSLKTLHVDDFQGEVIIPQEILNKRLQLEDQRKWELTKLGEQIYLHKRIPWSVQYCNFKILSYNVLSQQLMLDNKFLYKGCDEQCLDWSYRWPLLQHEICHLQPDIMTLQEVEATHYHTNFLPFLNNMGYNCVYKKRTNDKVDGCAIIYKKGMFNLIEQVSVEFNQPYGGSSLNRDNIGLIVKLTPIEFESPFCVATTHLLFNPRRKDIRIAQLAVLFAELDRLCYEDEKGGYPIYCPVILTGDFNSDPYSKEYEFVHRGTVFCGQNYNTYSREQVFGNELNQLIPAALGISDYCQHSVLEQSRYLEKIKGNQNLFSLADKRLLELDTIKLFNTSRRPDQKNSNANIHTAMPATPSNGVLRHNFLLNSVYRKRYDEEVTTKHAMGWIMVDYIFYSKIKNPHVEQVRKHQLCEGSLKLLGKYRLPSKYEANKLGILPSLICPSDHYPLAAQFVLTS